MQVIKFKGRSGKTGSWVYGYLVEGHQKYILEEIMESDPKYLEPVDSETVGQYIGLRDRNGVEIYEGDIVNTTIPEGITFRGVVKFKDGGFYVEAESTRLFNWPDYEILVVGNIYEAVAEVRRSV